MAQSVQEARSTSARQSGQLLGGAVGAGRDRRPVRTASSDVAERRTLERRTPSTASPERVRFADRREHRRPAPSWPTAFEAPGRRNPVTEHEIKQLYAAA